MQALDEEDTLKAPSIDGLLNIRDEGTVLLIPCLADRVVDWNKLCKYI